jgi:TetR/AcrR family transcriptional regulator
VPTSESIRGRRRQGRRRRGRRQEAHLAARLDILKSAAAAFRKYGYHGATVERVASAVPMKKGNLYHYFKDKEAILFACHEYSLDRLLELLEDVEAAPRPADEKLRRLIVASVHTSLDELHGTALFLDLEALTPAHRRAVVLRRDRFDHGLRRIVAEGVANGTFGRIDPKLLSFAILGAVNWIPRWFDPSGPASSDDVARGFADYLIAGLRRS